MDMPLLEEAVGLCGDWDKETSRELLNHLYYALKKFERISKPPKLPSAGPRGSKLESFSSRTTLMLIGFSLAIIPLKFSRKTSLLNVTKECLERLCELLNLSPLLKENKAEKHEVQVAMSSLVMFFSSLDAKAPAIVSLPNKRPSSGGIPDVKKIRPEADQSGTK